MDAQHLTLENIQTTFLDQYQLSDENFKRGLVNVFLTLTRTHKTNAKEVRTMGKLTPADSWANALLLMLEHHLTFNYLDDANRLRTYKKLQADYEKLKALPVSEFSPAIWDKLVAQADQFL